VNYAHNRVLVICKTETAVRYWMQQLAALIALSAIDSRVSIESHILDTDVERQVGPVVIPSSGVGGLSLLEVSYDSMEADPNQLPLDVNASSEPAFIVHARYGDSGHAWLALNARDALWSCSNFVAAHLDGFDRESQFASLAVREWLNCSTDARRAVAK